MIKKTTWVICFLGFLAFPLLSFASYGGGTYGSGGFGNSSSTDTTAPSISAISSGTPSQTSVTITWSTNEAATSQVIYSTDTSYNLLTSATNNLVTSHSVTVNGLSANTFYNYKVVSKDAANNIATSSANSFTTANVSSGGGGGGGGGGGTSSAKPKVDAGSTQTVSTSTITLAGSASVSDSKIASYLWRKTRGNEVTIVSPNSATTQVTGLTDGTYYFELSATAENGKIGTDTVKIKARDVVPSSDGVVNNAPPISGPDNSVPGCEAGYIFSIINGQRCPVGTSNTPINNSPSTVTVSVTANVLNVRNSPVSGAVVGKVTRGTVGSIISGSLNDAWVEVEFSNGVKGYVSRAYLNAQGTGVATTPTVPTNPGIIPSGVEQIRVVSRTTLIVRGSVGGGIVGRVQPGAVGSVLERIPSANGLAWLKVQFPGLVGWVSSMYTVPITAAQNNPVQTPVQVQSNTTSSLEIVTTTPTSSIIRSSVGGGIAGRVPAGTIGIVLERIPSANGLAWLKVQFPTVTGWISSSLVR